MIRIDPKGLKDLVTNYISSFKSSSSVSVEILNVVQDQSKITIEGTYYVGFSSVRHGFKAIFDNTYNLLEINLNYLNEKKI